ncbi:MAG: cardiolipin synthase [Spirochaetaceae bacterium]|jgi:cardiolipin synthase|nr:cardiolipin synthase [Spirochaetaceae bacterium]
MKNKAISFFSKQKNFVILLLALQLSFIAALIAASSIFLIYIDGVLTLLSVIVSVHILNKNNKPAYKITWIFLILTFPLFGGLFYMIFYLQSDPKKYRISIKKILKKSRPFFFIPPNALKDLKEDPYFIHARFLQERKGFPVYTHTETVYFPLGELFYKRLLEELEKAERYIFLEFFIISSGVMLDGIMKILAKKTRAGVDVRIIYDDLGCLNKLPPDFLQTAKNLNIKLQVFNPFRPVLSSLQNYRDHRKIVSIDGRTAFTGGVNIGDEYINVYEKYGRWKDAGVMIKGCAAWSLTLIFIGMWNSKFTEGEDEEEYINFYPWKEKECSIKGSGYVQPYSSNPIDKEYVSEQVYLRIINNAKDYVYINTPYLIPDESVCSQLASQARAGTDVRIITPSMPDKPLVHMVTRAYYRRLLEAGVRIYEYSKGFNHAKTFVSDDVCASIGTANLDYRSLCLHFECGVWIYKTPAVMDVKKDFLQTLSQSREITLKDCERSAFRRILDDVLCILAPIL